MTTSPFKAAGIAMMDQSFMSANTHMEPVLHASKLPVDNAPRLQQAPMLAPNDGSLAHSTNTGLQRRVSVLAWRTSQTQAPQHQRPQLTTEYAPSPAPGSTVAAVSKKILRRQHLEHSRPSEGDPTKGPFPSSPPRLETSGSNTNNVRLVHYADNGPSRKNEDQFPFEDDHSKELMIESPRTMWRQQFWKKNTPWGTDRRNFAGDAQYEAGHKPTARNYNNTSRWVFEKVPLRHNSEETIRQIVVKLEQHGNSTFGLTRGFKAFDKDSCLTIDKGEMKAVLSNFSIELSEEELETIVQDFGVRDLNDDQGTSVRYQDLVLAVDTIAGRHPFEMNTGRYITKLKARYLKDVHGRRLCTPGSTAPVGTPSGGCYYPRKDGLPSSNGRKSVNW